MQDPMLNMSNIDQTSIEITNDRSTGLSEEIVKYSSAVANVADSNDGQASRKNHLKLVLVGVLTGFSIGFVTMGLLSAAHIVTPVWIVPMVAVIQSLLVISISKT